MAYPITSDEGDANLAWDSQDGVSMPTPYNTGRLNSVDLSQMPIAAEMAKLGVDVGNETKMRAYYSRVAIN